MPFEIWQHRTSGERSLVVSHAGLTVVAAGPLRPNEDPAHVLGTHSNQHHNTQALLDMRRHPEAYRRQWVLDAAGHAVRLPDHGETADGPH
jgi:hypothetical protein